MAQPYGMPVTAAQARQAAAGALAEARRQGWMMAVAVVDPSGTLVHFEKIDDTQTGSVQVAIDKAMCAARFKRSTKAFQDLLAGGGTGLRVMTFPGVIASEGGMPLVVDNRIIGAIGVSGGTSEEDGQCALAGIAALA